MLKQRKSVQMQFFKRIEPLLEAQQGIDVWSRYQQFLWKPLSDHLYKSLEQPFQKYLQKRR